MKLSQGLVLITAVLSLASCSSSSKSGTKATTAPPSAGSTAAASGKTMAVTESEFTINLASKTLTAGTYTFKVTNSGKFPHNLTVSGPGVQDKASPTLDGGKAGEVTVTLQKGSYDFYCSVDSHKSKGMDLTVTVT